MNKRATLAAGAGGGLGWWLALLLPVLVLLTACEDPTSIGSSLDVDTGALTTNYVDTFTVRTSTVLTDSVPSSSSGYLLLGRYQDSRLGTLTARSYLQLGLNGTLDATDTVLDSVVLELATDTYRYGDTTRQQTVEVHQLQTDLRGTTTYYTADARPYDAAMLGRRTFRAGRLGSSFRVPLDNALGRRLLSAAQAGALSSDDELLALLPGLVLTPAATDDATLLRFSVANTALILYAHLNTDPGTTLTYGFAATYGPKHFYQLQAERRGTLLSSLTQLRQELGSTVTAEEAYIQAGLGVQTKVEFPYLDQLRSLGGNIVFNAASLEMEVLADSENRNLPPPTALVPRLALAGNRLGSYFLDAGGNIVTSNYRRDISTHTGLERGVYSLSMTTYCTQVLARSLSNQGIFVGAYSPGVAERVVLGSGRNATTPMRLRVYFTRVSI